jgi:hypothetical protein
MWNVFYKDIEEPKWSWLLFGTQVANILVLDINLRQIPEFWDRTPGYISSVMNTHAQSCPNETQVLLMY